MARQRLLPNTIGAATAKRLNAIRHAAILPLTTLQPYWPVLLFGSLLLVFGAQWASWQGWNFLALMFGSMAGSLGLVVFVSVVLGCRAPKRTFKHLLNGPLADDPNPVLLCDAQGHPIGGNSAAGEQFDPVEWLTSWCIEPGRQVASIQFEVSRQGAAKRVFRRAKTQLRVQAYQSGPYLVWRLEQAQQISHRTADDLGLPLLSGDAENGFVANKAAQAALPEEFLNDRNKLSSFHDEIELEDGTRVQPLSTIGRDGVTDLLLIPSGRFLPASPRQHSVATNSADFEHIPVALMTLAPSGAIVGTNRLARSLLGLGRGEDRYFWDVVEALGRPVSDWLDDARAGRALGRPEVLRASLPHEETFVQIILRKAKDSTEPGTLVAVISDATELKSLEARFVQSQKMQAIGQLAGGVAHDFNNLLTAISGHCDLLMLNRDRFDADYDDLLQIHQNANRAAALVRQLLAFSRKQTLKPEIFPLESLLEDLTHLLTRLVGERITLTLSHDPNLASIRADRRQLEQVIMNLVVNARDAMPMGGKIKVETRLVQLETELEIGRARVPSGSYAVIEVTDDGIGIPASIRDKIFEPFFTTKKLGEGTGLGLSTAYGIVKQMGGFIFVESEEGTGTSFSLYFANHVCAAEASAAETECKNTQEPVPVAAQPAAGLLFANSEAPNGDARVSSQPEKKPAVEISNSLKQGQTATGCDAPLRDVDEEELAKIISTSDGAQVSGGFAASCGANPPFNSKGKPSGGVVLPEREKTGPCSQNSPSTNSKPEKENGTILLVEDEAPVRAFAARALRLQGYKVFEAADGEQALEFLETLRSPIDLFVTDVIMPGIDGPGWVTQALATRPDTPVVFMSGYAEDALSAQLMRIPRSGFLGKPFSLQELTTSIGEQIGSE